MKEFTKPEIMHRLGYMQAHPELITEDMKITMRSIISPKIKSTTEDMVIPKSNTGNQIIDDAVDFALNFRNIPPYLQDQIAAHIQANRPQDADTLKLKAGITALGIPEMELNTNNMDKTFSIDKQ